jgi:glycosyltransferase involved in cell wall biosynthesis
LLLLGDGPQRRQLERQARDEGVAERVRFAGLRPDATRLLPVIDVVAFSSIWEGLSVAMLEAMAAARCIVGTQVPGILEAVRHEREALIVPVGDVAQLAAALGRVATSPQLRAELGRAARKRFQEQFTAERMVRDYEILYREARARGGGGSHGPEDLPGREISRTPSEGDLSEPISRPERDQPPPPEASS